MTRGMNRRPGVAYRRPNGDADRVAVESAGDSTLSAEDLPNGEWTAAVHPEDRERLRGALSERDVDVVYRLLVDGNRRWIHERGSSIGESGDVVGYLFAAGDRIERRRELERERERLEEFSSVVSHDLRNPLSIAVGNVELAREMKGDEAAERLDRAHDALERMDALIGDLLALARQGRTVEKPAETDLRTVVDRAWETVGVDAPAELTVREPLPRIECDGRRLRRVLENLFRNALEHGPTGDRSAPEYGEATDREAIADETNERTTIEERATSDPVRIEVGTLSDADGFYVADDGSGIAPEEREEVFDLGHTTAPDGTGFGLAIVDRIVAAHGWSVRVVESEAGGARFEFGDVDVADEPET